MVPVTRDHPFLEYDNYLTSSTIKRGRTVKICDYCGLSIPIGMIHKSHIFTDYESHPTHLECSLPFCASLQ